MVPLLSVMSLVQNPEYEGDFDTERSKIGVLKKIRYVNSICSPRYTFLLLGVASKKTSLSFVSLVICCDEPPYVLLLLLLFDDAVT